MEKENKDQMGCELVAFLKDSAVMIPPAAVKRVPLVAQ